MLSTVTADPGVVGGIIAILGGVGTVVGYLLRSQWARDAFARFVVEVEAVVREVSQVYTDEITRARMDGTLTEEEKATARAMAVARLKVNFGAKGLARLARILGVADENVDRWVGSHVEAAVSRVKAQARGLDPDKTPRVIGPSKPRLS